MPDRKLKRGASPVGGPIDSRSQPAIVFPRTLLQDRDRSLHSKPAYASHRSRPTAILVSAGHRAELKLSSAGIVLDAPVKNRRRQSDVSRGHKRNVGDE